MLGMRTGGQDLTRNEILAADLYRTTVRDFASLTKPCIEFIYVTWGIA